MHNNIECLCPLCNPNIVSDLKNENKIMADQLNSISELVFGYREGKYPEIIEQIKHLKEKSSKHQMNENAESLFDLIDKLSELKETILEED